MARQVLILGAGRFGSAVATELERLGHEVLAVDSDTDVIEAIADEVTQAIVADVTDVDTLRRLGAADFDVAVVAIGTDERASILSTVLLKRLGVRYVLSKAHDPLHGDILRMVGADRVVFPELETGRRVAHSLTMPHAVVDYFDVGPGYGLAKVSCKSCAGKTIEELNLRRRYGVTPLFLHRDDKVMVNPHPSERLQATDELVVAGLDEQLGRLDI